MHRFFTLSRLLAPCGGLLVALSLLVSCGGDIDVKVLSRPTVTQEDPCNMRSLPANFTAQSLVQPNTPAFIAKIVKSEIKAEQTLQSDWQAAPFQTGVDTNTTPGDVLLQGNAESNVESLTYNSTFLLYVATAHDGFAWQSWKHTKGYNVILDKVSVHLYASGPVYWPHQTVTWMVRLYQSDKTTPLSTERTVSVYLQAGTVYSALTAIDFSSEEIEIADDTQIWIKVYGVTSDQSSPANQFGVKYHSTTSTYGNGQMDGQDYNDLSESTNIGDMAFRIAFLPTYVTQGYLSDRLDLGSVPIVNGEWRIDQITPSDSSITMLAWAVPDINDYTATVPAYWSDLDGYYWTRLTTNGIRYVMIGNDGTVGGVGYVAYSDDRGATWTISVTTASGAAPEDVVWTGTQYVRTTYNSRDVYTSPNGEDWTLYTDALPSAGTWKMAYDNSGRILAVRTDTSNVMATSDDDGASWTSRSGGASQWNAPVWTGSAFFTTAAGSTANAQSSTDGASWTPRTMPYTRTWYKPAVDQATGLMVLLGYVYPGTSYYSRSSDNGATWNSITAPTNYGFSIEWDGCNFISANRVAVLSSPDGETWTEEDTYADTSTNPYSVGTIDRESWFQVNAGNKMVVAAHTGKVYLGTVEDGDAITELVRYYLFTAVLAPDTGTNSQTPSLRSVLASFPTWLTFSTHTRLGYEPIIMDVSSLQTKISDTEPTSVGQITLRLGLNKNLSAWMDRNYPRNREARIAMGFDAEGFSESDFTDYYRGYVEDWSIEGDDTVSIRLRDFSKTWKGVPVPAKWQGVTDDVDYADEHPVDVIADILSGYVGAPSKAIDSASFAEVKVDTPDWVITRTLTGKTFDAQDLLEQLRKLLSCYFIPQRDGRIKLKRWDSGESSVRTLSDQDLMGVKYAGNSGSLINQVNAYFHITSDDAGRGGNGTGYLVNNSPGPYAVGSMTIACDTGTGTILDGDYVQFDGDGTLYRVTSDLSAGSFAIAEPGLMQELANNTAITVFGTGLAIVVDATSQANWNETKIRKVMDYWTTAGHDAQVSEAAYKIVARYADIPDILTFGLDIRHVDLEVGDIVTISTYRAPSENLTGIVGEKYQITSLNLNWRSHRIDVSCLHVGAAARTLYGYFGSGTYFSPHYFARPYWGQQLA